MQSNTLAAPGTEDDRQIFPSATATQDAFAARILAQEKLEQFIEQHRAEVLQMRPTATLHNCWARPDYCLTLTVYCNEKSSEAVLALSTAAGSQPFWQVQARMATAEAALNGLKILFRQRFASFEVLVKQNCK